MNVILTENILRTGWNSQGLNRHLVVLELLNWRLYTLFNLLYTIHHTQGVHKKIDTDIVDYIIIL